MEKLGPRVFAAIEAVFVRDLPEESHSGIDKHGALANLKEHGARLPVTTIKVGFLGRKTKKEINWTGLEGIIVGFAQIAIPDKYPHARRDLVSHAMRAARAAARGYHALGRS